MTLAVAEGDFSRAKAIDEDASLIADEFQGGNNAYGHWYRVARLQYLVSIGRPDLAAGQATELLGRLIGTTDRALLDRVRSAGALAFAAIGDVPQSTGLVGEITLGPLGRVPDFIAEAEAVLGNVRGLHVRQAEEHLDRAARIYSDLGHETSRLSIETVRSLLKLGDRNDEAPAPNTVLDPQTEQRPGARTQMFRGAAALVDLASRPRLMGQEVLLLIEQGMLGTDPKLANSRVPDTKNF